MRLDVRSRGICLTAALRSHLERRLYFSLCRFGERVGRVTAWISDLNGPRGGADKCCRISARFVPVGVVVVQATDVDIHAAVDRAADCLGRSFRRHLQRRRALRTGRESVRLEQDLRWLRA